MVQNETNLRVSSIVRAGGARYTVAHAETDSDAAPFYAASCAAVDMCQPL